MSRTTIYLDHHATTPVDPRVLEIMLPYFCERYGNPASRAHAAGWEAEEAVEKARAEVASLIGANADEIVFTSGATESNNLAIKGVCEQLRDQRDHLLVTAIEHPAVLESARHVETIGGRLSVVATGPSGVVSATDVADLVDSRTALVSVMAANNEIGTIQPLAEIGRLIHAHGALLHTDAAQAVGKIPFDVNEFDVDLASISAHKMYGPKGIGALYVRRRGRRVRLAAQMHGGGHERGLRAGTLPVPLIVGFGMACRIAVAEMADESKRLAALRHRLHSALQAELDEVYLNGDAERRLPGNLNLSFAWIEGESLIVGLKGIAVSSGSACSTQRNEPSHVLRAIGVSDDLAHTAIRFGLGRFNTADEIDEVARRVVKVVRRLRAMSPLYEIHKRGVDVRKALA